MVQARSPVLRNNAAAPGIWRLPLLVAAATVLCLVSAACSSAQESLAGSDTAAVESSAVESVPRASTTAAPTTLATTPGTEPPIEVYGAVPVVPGVDPATVPRAWVTSTGVVGAVLDRDGDRTLIRTPCGGEAWVDGGQRVAPVAVVIDPGHGGEEPGAVGPSGLVEKDLNLLIAQQVVAELGRVGIAAQLTRTADYRITLLSRAEIATALEVEAFVSIHHNAAPAVPWPGPGSETYYQIADDESRRLAGLLYEEIVDALDDFDAEWMADSDAGAKYRPNSGGGDYYGILRRSAGVPAVLTEAAYLSNATEEALLQRPEVQQAEARAIAQGIARFLTTSDPGSGFVDPLPRTSPAGPGGGADNCVDPALE